MSAVLPPLPEVVVDDEGAPRMRWRWLRKNPTLVLGAVLLVLVALVIRTGASVAVRGAVRARTAAVAERELSPPGSEGCSASAHPGHDGSHADESGSKS